MIDYRIENNRLVVDLSGELGMFTVSKFNEVFATALEETSIYAVVIDMAKLDIMDSCGLGALVSALKMVTARGGFIHLARMKAGIVELLYLTKLEKRFRLFSSLEDALDAPPLSPLDLASAPAA